MEDYLKKKKFWRIFNMTKQRINPEQRFDVIVRFKDWIISFLLDKFGYFYASIRSLFRNFKKESSESLTPTQIPASPTFS